MTLDQRGQQTRDHALPYVADGAPQAFEPPALIVGDHGVLEPLVDQCEQFAREVAAGAGPAGNALEGSLPRRKKIGPSICWSRR